MTYRIQKLDRRFKLHSHGFEVMLEWRWRFGFEFGGAADNETYAECTKYIRACRKVLGNEFFKYGNPEGRWAEIVKIKDDSFGRTIKTSRLFLKSEKALTLVTLGIT